ncbi:MAG: hypothetical protein WC461_00160 [Candidatus Paceibacterota bacterium]
MKGKRLLKQLLYGAIFAAILFLSFSLFIIRSLSRRRRAPTKSKIKAKPA